MLQIYILITTISFLCGAYLAIDNPQEDIGYNIALCLMAFIPLAHMVPIWFTMEEHL